MNTIELSTSGLMLYAFVENIHDVTFYPEVFVSLSIFPYFDMVKTSLSSTTKPIHLSKNCKEYTISKALCQVDHYV